MSDSQLKNLNGKRLIVLCSRERRKGLLYGAEMSTDVVRAKTTQVLPVDQRELAWVVSVLFYPSTLTYQVIPACLLYKLSVFPLCKSFEYPQSI